MIIHNFPDIPSMVLILLVVIMVCLYVVNGMFLFHIITKQLEIYIKLLELLTLPSLAGLCEVLNIFQAVKYHISEWGLT